MSVATWLEGAVEKLKRAEIETARLDCLILLEDCVNKDRSWLLAHPEFKLSKEQITKLNSQIERRITHEPLAYIRNQTEFYGRDFYVDRRVLEPRPESETIIKFLKGLITNNEPSTIVDIGTGSGALAITAKLEVHSAKVIATDINSECLEVAKQNAKTLNTGIIFLKGSLLEPLNTLKLKNYFLLCNLPYVPNDFKLNPAAMKEPQIAIFGGLDGLDLYQELFKQIENSVYKPLFMLTESLPLQHKKLAALAKLSGYELTQTDDFIQCFKRLIS